MLVNSTLGHYAGKRVLNALDGKEYGVLEIPKGSRTRIIIIDDQKGAGYDESTGTVKGCRVWSDNPEAGQGARKMNWYRGVSNSVGEQTLINVRHLTILEDV